MQEDENFAVIKEKIKNKPLNRKKLLRRTVITACMALLFGVIACASFLILEPVFSNLLNPTPKTIDEKITFPETNQDILPEEFLQEENEEDIIAQQAELDGITALTDAQLEAIYDRMNLKAADVASIGARLYQLVIGLQKAVVYISGADAERNWFDVVYKNTDKRAGVIIAGTGEAYYVLSDYESLESTENLQITFFDGSTAPCELIQSDESIGYAVLMVQYADIDADTIADLRVAVLGSSNATLTQGNFIMVVGTINDNEDSVSYGMITTKGELVQKPDRNYRYFGTNIYSSEDTSGIVFNLYGQVIGFSNNDNNSSSLKNQLSFIGISELRKTMETMTNNIERSYLGIYGMDVTQAISDEYGIPKGAYITDIIMNSPAMESGLQSGDIIVGLDYYDIDSFTELSNYLLSNKIEKTVKVSIMRQNKTSYGRIFIDVTFIGVGVENEVY